MQNGEFIIIGLQPWYTDIGSNCKNIALELAKSNKVIYINIPLNRNTLRKEKGQPHIDDYHHIIKGKKDPLEKISNSFWSYSPKRIHESINWIPSTRIFSYFNYINNKRLAKDIQEVADRVGFKNYILFNDNDIFRGYWLKELLQPKLYIYYCRDFLTSSGYFKKHGSILEPLHISKADLALSNSLYLTRYLNKYNTHAYFTGQGCNVALFDASKEYDIPTDIPKSGKPIIGYVGTITARRLDISILHTLITKRADWDFVFVGPEDDIFKKSSLRHFSNVFFTGKKDVKQLPAYIRAFDVCINPQLVNDLTIGNYPLKIDEYLAMGKPVVATKTYAMEMFQNYCYLAENSEDYIRLISQGLSEDSVYLQKKRIHLAKHHSWENSVLKMYEYIDKILSGKNNKMSESKLHSI